MRFNEAFSLGKENNVNIAYSNEAFELWLLLHLQNVDKKTALLRKEINLILQEAVRKHKKYQDFEYKHGDPEIVNIILKIGNENKAIDRAMALHQEHIKNKLAPIDSNPCTTIYLLVTKLRELIQYYSYK